MNAGASCAIAIFARAPVAGQCKSRLIPRLGADGAARLQEWMTERSLRTAVEAGLEHIALWCAPNTEHAFFASCAARFGVRLVAQEGADLGLRMDHAFARAGGPMLLMGTDCPSITADDLRACAVALQNADAAFLPAEDGGYGLVGLNAPCPEIFSNMMWSTSGVMAQTRARLAAAGKCWREIRTIWDVDEPEDYERLKASGILDGARNRGT
ncbi:MAG: TIGR04282 family arsenosugar biosynthesis glycosyltransferase [Beijerinckiaceae bacterium]